MSLFKSIFGDSNEEATISNFDWTPLTNLGQLNEIIDLSTEKPIAIFKHSTRCSISRMALKQFENEFDLQDKIAIYFLDLLNYREVSNEIANRFNVMHQSPQILLIKDGKAIYHDSHSDIEAENLKQYL
jgi:bacillithiol system protein YtxJ